MDADELIFDNDLNYLKSSIHIVDLNEDRHTGKSIEIKAYNLKKDNIL